ncbi:beta-ketoacyl synthase N-terminal-like domain-containing protein [uncultured Arcticibacterium sp.]|uniref:beta-ketoacyl-[acyl-carrier-protein] synthase family protein n=1 Tax=uncultured Arcticibacterium sp. TaxID=2173042 RepID=UPI0030FC506C
MSVYVAAKNIISPLGFTSKANFKAICQGKSGVALVDDKVYEEAFYGSKINREEVYKNFGPSEDYTFLEQLLILSIKDALSQDASINIESERTIIILSTTKGNVDLLDPEEAKLFPSEKKFLWNTGDLLSTYFKNPNKTLVVSNACVSGVVAINLAKRLLDAEKYDQAVIVGIDILSPFIVSGFQSFKALSQGICKPYDKNRDGINIGEACATIVLTKEKNEIEVLGGSSTNDANHISGPSRTGEGLLLSIEKALKMSNLTASEIDYISGHGTATPFNDEMESFAVSRAGLSNVPMNSLKSYFGHTLGAAGILESIITFHSMEENTLIATKGHEENGVSQAINIISKTVSKELKTCIKLGAGFGGSNASIIFRKHD